MDFLTSPFIVPVAGCAVGVIAIVSGIWFEAHNAETRQSSVWR